MNCGNCQHFERMKWYKAIDKDESYQHGGNCVMLARALEVTNSFLWAKEHLYVMETFGCIFFKEKGIEHGI